MVLISSVATSHTVADPADQAFDHSLAGSVLNTDSLLMLAQNSDDDDLLLGDDDDLLLGDDDDLLLGDDDDLLLSDDDDLLLSDDDDLLLGDDGDGYEEVEESADAAGQAHTQVFKENRFPNATTCRTCHPDHYNEWSMSQHAYSEMSPIFNTMQGAVYKLTNGTNGDFCVRCHTPVGMNLEEKEYMRVADRHPTAREGVTCIACHRLKNAYGKVSGRLAIVEGDLFQPVYGPTGDEELARVLQNPDQYRVVTDPEEQGRAIHTKVVKFEQISTSGFCGTCHDVTLVNNFRLEEAFSEYKSSPAAKNGVTCQDCHMGTVPGVPSPFRNEPAAVVGGVPTLPRRRTDHRFPGPDYPIIHPALFPINSTAYELATINQWLTFDHKAGWGTDEFEDEVDDDHEFPDHWAAADDRYDARDIIDEQMEKRAEMEVLRTQILKVGYLLGDIVVDKADAKGIKFRVQVKSGTDGHNVPTGFIAERMVYLRVTVNDSTGKQVYISGDLDPNGDVRDLHSLYVHNGELPLDKDLFSLQSKFLTRNLRGGEREQVLPLNVSLGPLLFLRPTTDPSILRGGNLGARIHRVGIEPLGERWGKYNIDKDMLTGNGPYEVNVKLIAGMIPVNLLDAIQAVGFDYFMSPKELADGIVEGQQVLWEKNMTIQN